MASLDLNQLGSLIVGIGGVATAVFSGYKTLQAQRASQKSANEATNVKNWQTLYDELREDITRIKRDHAEERKQWARERESLQTRIDLLVEHSSAKDSKIAELSGQVYSMQQQLKTVDKPPSK